MPRTRPRTPRRGARTAGAAALVTLAVLVSGCSKPVPSRTELVEALQRTGMSTGEARCVSDAILDTLSKDEVAAIVERGPSGAPVDAPGETDGTLTKVRAALTACQAESGTTTTSTTVVDGGATTTTVPVTGDQIGPTSTTDADDDSSTTVGGNSPSTGGG